MRFSRETLLFAGMVLLSAAVSVYLAFFLPHRTAPVESDLWPKLRANLIEKHYLKGYYSIHYTPEVRALDGQQVSVDGFVLPLESKEKVSHFLLSIRSPTCSFCPAGEPNEIIEVQTKEPIAWTDQRVNMQGIFKLMAPENEQGIFFQLHAATPTESLPERIAAAPSTHAIKPMQSYRFIELTGKDYQQQKETTLQPFLTKPAVIAFWRSDCAPCLQEMKLLPTIADSHPTLPILLISLHDVKHTKEHLPPLPSHVKVFVAMEEPKSMLQAFGNEKILALPYSIMLDANGQICGKHHGILSSNKLKEWQALCH